MKTELKKNGICTFCKSKLDDKGICNKSGCWFVNKPQYIQIKEGDEKC